MAATYHVVSFAGPGKAARSGGPRANRDVHDDIGRYLRLGPLGTALLPYERPRVLLVDELDKSDIDLPNDLLTIFEEGEYSIPELARLDTDTTEVMDGDGARVPVRGGQVACRAFPLVVMTSNGEREFPPAFLRRCVRVHLGQREGLAELAAIVRSHLGDDLADRSHDLIERFLERSSAGALATYQLLNAVYLLRHADADDRHALADQIMPYLGGTTDDL